MTHGNSHNAEGARMPAREWAPLIVQRSSQTSASPKPKRQQPADYMLSI